MLVFVVVDDVGRMLLVRRQMLAVDRVSAVCVYTLNTLVSRRQEWACRKTDPDCFDPKQDEENAVMRFYDAPSACI